MRKQYVAGRVTDRLSQPFKQEKPRSERPIAGQGQQRYSSHRDPIAEQRQQPESSRPIADTARKQTQGIADQFPEPSDHSHRRRARPQHGEVRPYDAARALIGEIGEETHGAKQQNKAESNRSAPRAVLSILNGPCCHSCPSLYRLWPNPAQTTLNLIGEKTC